MLAGRLDRAGADGQALGFHPEVFKKAARDRKAKAVDISLAKDFLGHAHRDNFDAAVLIAGDGDYVPLVEEVKRLGKIVDVMFFRGPGLGLSPELRLAADTFHEINTVFQEQWRKLLEQPAGADTA